MSIRARGRIGAVHTHATCLRCGGLISLAMAPGAVNSHACTGLAPTTRAQATRGEKPGKSPGSPTLHAQSSPETSGFPGKVLAEFSGRLERCAVDRAAYDAEADAVRAFVGGARTC